MKHFLTLKDLTPDEIKKIIERAMKVKKHPGKYEKAMRNKTLYMLFQKPSLRTRVSFEVGMTQMGGHAIYYATEHGPLGKKESISDTAQCVSRYCDIVMARVFKHSDIEEFAQHATIPVINALSNFSHPCQIMADLTTIQEKKGELKGLKLAYLGDSNNNVTHSLLYGGTQVGMHVAVGCPKGDKYEPQKKVVQEARDFAQKSGGSVMVTDDAAEAAKDADVIYTDSWMSYHIPKEEEAERVKLFQPYQVNAGLMKRAKPDAIFMNCLPAMRGYEQTADVIDGEQSVVFDQAENRLHAQKIIMLHLLDSL